MGFFDFLNQPIDWVSAFLFLMVIGVIGYIIMKKRREVFLKQAEIEKRIAEADRQVPTQDNHERPSETQ